MINLTSELVLTANLNPKQLDAAIRWAILYAIEKESLQIDPTSAKTITYNQATSAL